MWLIFRAGARYWLSMRSGSSPGSVRKLASTDAAWRRFRPARRATGRAPYSMPSAHLRRAGWSPWRCRTSPCDRRPTRAHRPSPGACSPGRSCRGSGARPPGRWRRPASEGGPEAAEAGATGSGSGVSGRASVLVARFCSRSRGGRGRVGAVAEGVGGGRSSTRGIGGGSTGAGSITRGGTGGTSSAADSTRHLGLRRSAGAHGQKQRDDQERTVHVESDRVRRRDTPSLTALVYACGKTRRNRVPRPGVDSTSTSPSCSWTMR